MAEESGDTGGSGEDRARDTDHVGCGEGDS